MGGVCRADTAPFSAHGGFRAADVRGNGIRRMADGTGFGRPLAFGTAGRGGGNDGEGGRFGAGRRAAGALGSRSGNGRRAALPRAVIRLSTARMAGRQRVAAEAENAPAYRRGKHRRFQPRGVGFGQRHRRIGHGRGGTAAAGRQGKRFFRRPPAPARTHPLELAAAAARSGRRRGLDARALHWRAGRTVGRLVAGVPPVGAEPFD